MPGKIYRYLADDHRRLEDALRRATEHTGAINLEAYAEFRAGLLRHIGIEEKILLPSVQKARGGKSLPLASKLRLDHGALAALLVPTPTKSIINTIRAVLNGHNPLEEGPGGVYEQCEELAGSDADELFGNLQNFPAVKVAPYSDSPIAIESLQISLRKAGYDLES
jgi:hemerythrin HHE cation binding domain-containing protein